MLLTLALVLLAGLCAGAMNALAGGGSFVTLPALMLSGLDPRTANVTSAIALFPGQLTTGWLVRHDAEGAAGLSIRTLIIVSLIGGVAGAILLLSTPAGFFARLMPWLVLFATAVFAWGSFFQKRSSEGAALLGRRGALLAQFLIAVYGGYFGGGIGFLMMAAMTTAGVQPRAAAAAKNLLAAVMNAAAVAVFCFLPGVGWRQCAALAAGAVVGGLIGAWSLRRLPERVLRVAVIIIGTALTIGLFMRRT